MGLVWLRWRAALRTKWRTLLLLALLVGIGGGVALTSFAGAQRTDQAVPRFVAYSLPDNGGFLFGSYSSPPVASGAAADSLALFPAERRVVRLPQVVAYFRAPYLFLTTDPTGRSSNVGGLNTIGTADRDLYRRVDRPLVLDGHLPDPGHPFDVAVNELAARKRHLHAGSHLRLFAYSLAQIQGGGLNGIASIGPQAPTGPAFRVRVVGVVRFPQDVSAVVPLAAQQNVSYEGQQNLYLTPAFLTRLAAGLGIPVQQLPGINLVAIRLRHGAADWKAFAAAARKTGGRAITIGDSTNVYNIPRAAASTQRGVHLDVVALLLFGALAGLVTLLLVGQALARDAQLDQVDDTALRSLGATSAQLAGTTVSRAALIGVVGGAIAVAVAVAASPLMPVGVARQADLHPGLSADWGILASGFLAIVALVLATSTLPAWRVRRHRAAMPDERRVRGSSRALGDALARSSVSPVAAIGVRYGLERGRGRSAVPVSTAMIGAIMGVAALSAALTFGASLGHLLDSPRQQGWNWDVLVGNPHDMTDRETQGEALLAHNRYVGSYSAIAILAGAGQGNAYIDGVALDTLLAIDPLKGTAYPALLEGRPPRTAREIVLGSHTLQRLHRHVGQTVRTATPGGPLELRIVGRMIAPSVGDLFTNGLGDGGWVTGDLARQASAAPPAGPNGLPPTVFVLFAVRYAHGAPPNAAAASLRHEFGPTVLRQLPAEDVVNLHSVDRLPFVLAALVVLLGTATVGNTLFSAVRRRRRDLAILKTIGFVRRQVAAVVAWQATSFCVVAVAVGIPLGVISGRWAWKLVSSGIGSVSPPVVPIVALGIMVPAALLVGNLIAVVPGWSAARVAPAIVMRSE